MFIFFVLGVVMALLGTSLLVMGRGRVGSREISKTWARRLGVFLVAFFPVILVERILLAKFDPNEEIDAMLIHACLIGVWIIVSMLLLSMALRKPRRALPPREISVPQDELPGQAADRSSSRHSSRRAKQPPSNPFDFD